MHEQRWPGESEGLRDPVFDIDKNACDEFFEYVDIFYDGVALQRSLICDIEAADNNLFEALPQIIAAFEIEKKYASYFKEGAAAAHKLLTMQARSRWTSLAKFAPESEKDDEASTELTVIDMNSDNQAIDRKAQYIDGLMDEITIRDKDNLFLSSLKYYTLLRAPGFNKAQDQAFMLGALSIYDILYTQERGCESAETLQEKAEHEFNEKVESYGYDGGGLHIETTAEQLAIIIQRIRQNDPDKVLEALLEE